MFTNLDQERYRKHNLKGKIKKGIFRLLTESVGVGERGARDRTQRPLRSKRLRGQDTTVTTRTGHDSDYADRTRQRLRGQDMTVTTRTLTTNVEGFSQTLREQSAEIKYFCMFPYPIAISKFENGGYLRLKFRVRIVVDDADR